MNRFRKDLKLHAVRSAVGDGAGRKGQGWQRRRALLALPRRCAVRLLHRIQCAAALHADGDEALRRLKAECGYIQALVQQTRGEAGVRLWAQDGRTRAGKLAQRLVAGGETVLSAEEITREVAAWERREEMRMREIQSMPFALRIALCEALDALVGEILFAAKERRRAQRWVGANCRRGFAGRSPFFLERAAQLCVDLESPELHARVERAAERQGETMESIAERVHRSAADACLRLENLMQLRRLLEHLDWEKCFVRISTADMELNADPVGIYPRMDAASRACIRERTAELAAHLHLTESAVARCALRAANESLRENGANDPRSNVCWYLAEDAGRRALCRELGDLGGVKRCVPDAEGHRTVALTLCASFVLLILLLAALGNPFLWIYALPLAWGCAMRLIARFHGRWGKPLRLLKLKLDVLPDSARTLVVLPVLLSSEARTREMIGRMEALGCLERDERIDFLLLGDFRDADSAALPDDEAICAAARSGVAALNDRAERKKYYYLHRARSFRQQDEKWMGENRKRGALMALNRLLLNRRDAAEAFGAEGECAKALAGRFRYVVTLDADTEYLPGTVGKLVGTMLHPLNRACMLNGRRRGYAVLQPNMELTAQACSNAYVEMTAGRGGVDGYPASVSDFYQDRTGHGCFAGKGIYDVEAFARATEGRLRDDAILSHDLIEGILAGAALVNDVNFYDAAPENLHGDLSRLNRWTRGDWQLLPVAFSRMGILAVDRMKLISNLLRSLYAPALLGLLIHSVWLDRSGAFCAGLLLAFLEPLLHGGWGNWKRALFSLAVLPCTAACQMDAILRTLWRLAVSRRHLMDWIPAADAGAAGGNARLSGRVAALLLLPGLLRSFWIPAVLALLLLFWVGAGWAEDLSERKSGAREALRAEQKEFLRELARRTWRFFETFVPEDGCGLPPDNVQFDPPAGAAMRTSPTNIGLYMMSCYSARELGMLTEAALLRRWAQTVSTMEGLKKWQGQLYNWYDLEALAPMQPEYVSAVDSGNLAGALLLCARLAEALDGTLARRMEALARKMNLAALYDEERELFCIGMDVQSGALSRSHYDLYASESRILSYAAMMLGQVPAGHWKRLSRACVRVGSDVSLLSWSGTMFEYLMPELILHSKDQTLAGQSRRGVVACQMAAGRRLRRPWGVSESGYYAFDANLNYQYRAFGLPGLALSGMAAQDVVAPYAAALALAEAPTEAAENLRAMAEMGWMGEFGMFEAADYMQGDADRGPRIVCSHMAHHQGMLLCAVLNALQNDVLSRRFMEIPEARALRLLLQEKGWTRVKGRKQDLPLHGGERGKMLNDLARNGRRDLWADVQLLHGGGTTALVTARGGIFAWKKDWLLNRFGGDLRGAQEGIFVHLFDADTERATVLGRGGQARMDAGSVCFREEWEELKIEMTVAVSPEDGALYQHVRMHNTGRAARRLEITGCFAVAHALRRDMMAHPTFQNLFVESRRAGENGLMFVRKRREEGEELPKLIYLLSGGELCGWESDLEKLIGRTGCIGRPKGIARRLTGSVGNVLNPCAALRSELRLEAGEQRELHFALALAEAGQEDACMERMACTQAPRRARQLAHSQMRSMLAHGGVDANSFKRFQRVGALLLDPRLKGACFPNGDVCTPAERSLLWSAGISGDHPVMLAEVHETENLDCVRHALRLYGFFCMMGVETDFVLINHQNGDYHQNARNKLSALMASCHFGGNGGAYLLDRQNLSEENYRAILRFAALRWDADRDFHAQLRAMLDGLRREGGETSMAMRPGRVHFPEKLQFFNGYGGVEGEGYGICLRNGCLPPAPWSNVLAAENGGAIVTERGGGYAWTGSSRSGRLTAFANDPLREGWGWMFYLREEGDGRWLRLLPGDVPMTDFYVTHRPGESRWRSAAENIAFELEMRAEEMGVRMDVFLKNTGRTTRHLRLAACVDWLMGTDEADRAMLRTWSRFDACFASGAAPQVGCFLADDPRVRSGCDLLRFYGGGDMMNPQGFDALERADGGSTLYLPLSLRAGETRRCRFLLGGARDIASAYALAREFRAGEALRRSREDWTERLERLKIETPDAALNFIANGFLQAQTLNARIRGRTGLYQPGGAFGFRDQLQDMLLMLHYEPERVRRHLLVCAARQFEAGDVLHWWHEPYTGVRTRIRDDLLFLPFVTARYVRVTGDAGVLQDQAPFLEDVEIPPEREDVYADMRPTPHCATLHRHCMCAFHRAADTGEHGLCRMGGGDWNDGMNRVGVQGRGESIWLSEFLAVCAEEYAQIAPDVQDRAWLLALSARMREALEAQGWDGEWYLRAYADDGTRMGGRESACCRIDLISQAWAVLAGLNAARCRSALNAAWEQLADAELKLIRLLTPPFDGQDFDPGYIAAYPPGIRENGGQYTHAACWMLYALAEAGDAERAHRALEMLLPLNHARNRAEAERYRVEPYVMAADIYTESAHAGRGGWTWYTGSGAWMFLAILRLLGFERCGNRVRMNALLHQWREARISLRQGTSRYVLICRQGAQGVTLDGVPVEGEFIEMTDDGREHCAVFPPAKAEAER